MNRVLLIFLKCKLEWRFGSLFALFRIEIFWYFSPFCSLSLFLIIYLYLPSLFLVHQHAFCRSLFGKKSNFTMKRKFSCACIEYRIVAQENFVGNITIWNSVKFKPYNSCSADGNRNNETCIYAYILPFRLYQYANRLTVLGSVCYRCCYFFFFISLPLSLSHHFLSHISSIFLSMVYQQARTIPFSMVLYSENRISMKIFRASTSSNTWIQMNMSQ